MPSEEKRAWIMAVVTIASYAVYLAIILGRAESTELTQVSYVSTMLWTIAASITASILLNILVGTASPKGAKRKDSRDQEINRLGEYIGQSFVVIGGVTVLIMAMVKVDYFWIANAIYLAFVLSSILASVTKLVAYRRGFQKW
jgi:cell division protein FtsW (lipid II flippase)